MTSTPNRTQELVMELMGGQMAARMLDEFWMLATPEQRKLVTDAVVSAVVDPRDEYRYQRSEAIGAAVSRWSTEALADREDELRAEIARRISESLPSMVDRFVNQAIEELLRKATTEIGDSLKFRRVRSVP